MKQRKMILDFADNHPDIVLLMAKEIMEQVVWGISRRAIKAEGYPL